VYYSVFLGIGHCLTVVHLKKNYCNIVEVRHSIVYG